MGTANPLLVLSRLSSKRLLPLFVAKSGGAARCVAQSAEKQMPSPSSQISKCTKHSHSHRHAVCYKITHLSLSFDSFLALRSPLEDCFPGLGVAPAAAAAAVPAPAAAPPAPAPPRSASSPSAGSCWPCCTDRTEGQTVLIYRYRTTCV